MALETPERPRSGEYRVRYKVLDTGEGLKISHSTRSVNDMAFPQVGQGFVDYGLGIFSGEIRPVRAAYQQAESVGLHPVRVQERAIRELRESIWGL